MQEKHTPLSKSTYSIAIVECTRYRIHMRRQVQFMRINY